MSTTPDPRSDLERFNAVLYHLSEAKRWNSTPPMQGSPKLAIQLHLDEAERQTIDLFNDAGLRDIEAKMAAQEVPTYEAGEMTT